MRNIKLTTMNLLGDLPPIIDITDRLYRIRTWEEMPKKYIHHGVWDGTMHTGLRKPEDITTIVIHHAPPTASIETHAKNQANKWGAGICYHIMINPEQILQVNDLMSFTFHAGGHNTYTIGICVNRDLREGDLTDDERKFLYASILTVKALLPTVKYIKGHNELVATACPVTSVERIRKDIAALEEQMNYAQTNGEKAKVDQMIRRISDLYEKYRDPNNEYNAEAVRKLTIVHSVLEEKGWF